MYIRLKSIGSKFRVIPFSANEMMSLFNDQLRIHAFHPLYYHPRDHSDLFLEVPLFLEILYFEDLFLIFSSSVGVRHSSCWT